MVFPLQFFEIQVLGVVFLTFVVTKGVVIVVLPHRKKDKASKQQYRIKHVLKT